MHVLPTNRDFQQMNISQMLWCAGNLMADAETESKILSGKTGALDHLSTPDGEFERMVLEAQRAQENQG